MCAVVHVVIPNGAGGTSARKPAYISPNTATITIGVYTVNGATPSPLPTPLWITIATSPSLITDREHELHDHGYRIYRDRCRVAIFELRRKRQSVGSSADRPDRHGARDDSTELVSVGGVPASLRITPSGLSAGDDGLIHPIPFGVIALDADAHDRSAGSISKSNRAFDFGRNQ